MLRSQRWACRALDCRERDLGIYISSQHIGVLSERGREATTGHMDAHTQRPAQTARACGPQAARRRAPIAGSYPHNQVVQASRVVYLHRHTSIFLIGGAPRVRARRESGATWLSSSPVIGMTEQADSQENSFAPVFAGGGTPDRAAQTPEWPISHQRAARMSVNLLSTPQHLQQKGPSTFPLGFLCGAPLPPPVAPWWQ